MYNPKQLTHNLEETQQIIKENSHTCNLDQSQQQEILDSTDNTRRFIITARNNTDYNIKEIHTLRINN